MQTGVGRPGRLEACLRARGATDMAARFWICIPCLAIAPSDEKPCQRCGRKDFAEGANPKKLAFEELQRWTVDMARHSPVHVVLVSQWVQSLRRLTRRILTDEATDDDVALFWIRLSGVINELPEELNLVAELAEVADTEPNAFRTKLMLSHKAAVLEGARAIGTHLTRREHVYLDYRRQRAAHLTQDSYRVRPRKDGRGGHQLREARQVPWLKEDVAFPEVWATIAEFERTAAGELGVARHFASRVFNLVDSLSQAQELFHTAWG
jgi:hypothetical protein